MYVVLVLGMLMAWMFQIALTALQMQRYYKRLRGIRRLGKSATAMAGNRYFGRAYATLAVDPKTMVVTAAGYMRGVTVFANLREIPGLVGLPLTDLYETTGPLAKLPKLTATAFQSAAHMLRDALQKGESPREADDMAVPSSSGAALQPAPPSHPRATATPKVRRTTIARVIT